MGVIKWHNSRLRKMIGMYNRMYLERNIVIRKANSGDIKYCVSLSQTPELATIDNNTPNFSYFEECLEKLFYVATIDNKVVGLILGFQLTKSNFYLDLLVVSPQYRGLGIGDKLINHFEKMLSWRNAKDYFLIAPNFNDKTLSFYEKRGLKKGQTYTLYQGDIK